MDTILEQSDQFLVGQVLLVVIYHVSRVFVIVEASDSNLEWSTFVVATLLHIHLVLDSISLNHELFELVNKVGRNSASRMLSIVTLTTLDRIPNITTAAQAALTGPSSLVVTETVLHSELILGSEYRWIVIQRQVVYCTIRLSVNAQVFLDVGNDFIHELRDRLERDPVTVICISHTFHDNRVTAL